MADFQFNDNTSVRRFNQAPDAAAIFGNLSKTIRNVGQQANKLADMANEEKKVQDVFQSDLDSVFGLVGKGLTEQDYQSLVQEQNAIAQKEGIIRAHENFSLLNAVDEERAKIRLSAYTEEMKRLTLAMSNPTQPLSFSDAESRAFSALDGVVLGQDSVGNDVTMQLDTQSTGEMVALSRGMAANNLALRNAVDDNRHDLAIDSATTQYERETFSLIEKLGTSPENADILIPLFKDNANKYFGFGVQNINVHTLNALQSYANESVSNLPFTPGLEQDIFDVLDTFSDSIELRDGAGAFSAPGTSNSIKLNAIKEGVARDLALREREMASQRVVSNAIAEDELKTFVINEISLELQRQRALVGEPLGYTESIFIGSDFERELSAKLIKKSIELGHTDPDKILGSFDSIISNLTLDTNDSYVAKVTHNISFIADDEQALVDQELEAFQFFKRGLITISDYKDVSSKVKSAQAAGAKNSVFDSARREGGFGSSSVRTNIVSAAKSILKLNDTKVVTNSMTGAFITRFAEDNEQLSTNNLLVEQRHVFDRDIALNGGVLTVVQGIVPFTPEEEKFLRNLKPNIAGKEIGVTREAIRSTDTLFRDITLTIPGEDITRVRVNINTVNQRAIAYSQFLAMRRLLVYMEKDAEDLRVFENGSTSRGKGVDK